MILKSSILTALVLPFLAVAMEWQPRSSYNAFGDENLGRHHPIVFSNETHGFLLGGTTLNESAANDFYLYEEATDTWTRLPTPPWTPRSFGYGVVLNQWKHPKAYLGFGAAANGQRLNDLWEFDMTTYEWKQLSSLPGMGRRHPSMVPVLLSTGEWQLHVGLGDGFLGNDPDQFTNLNDYWAYDVAKDEWDRLPDFPASRRHHPFFFGIGSVSYTGLGHSDGQDPYIERDFYSFHADDNSQWVQEVDFASYVDDTLMTTEARVAGTEFSVVLPLEGQPDNSLQGAIGFVLSGDGDDHGSMETGEFHAFYPASTTETKHWQQLPPHPGHSRWAPGSFVMRGTARVYFTSGYDRETKTLQSDVWTIDLSTLWQPAEPDTDTPTLWPTETQWPTVSTSDVFIAETMSSSATSTVTTSSIRVLTTILALIVTMMH
ncbi:Kelch repeat type 1-containing protein [Seminavis robusta]|uniref:Kelch repeat type 1-containing protein n=1 Tax=Seminavis robusta TaxID=568900 RepID=A0A9N8E339_9STRA|nr:Kelch repeat type 1-containing protein [Seminavis robusta]|eukprot:Sro507_g156460.1 Kelch repeat type 1-containing protein (431) ;mRNA; r:14331-15623